MMKLGVKCVEDSVEVVGKSDLQMIAIAKIRVLDG